MLDATVKQTEPTTVAFLGMHGPYAQTPAGMGQLYAWVSAHGFIPVGMPAAAYFTMPETTPEEEAVWEIRAPIAGDAEEMAPDESGVGIKLLAPTTVASLMHKGPYSSIAPAYAALFRWIAEQGYSISGPPEEHFYSDPAEVPPEEYLTEIRVPVEKA